ncbi:MAG: adenine phosphoribosyltransferase [Candidatus Latescibacterota bacterium]|nr:adenine phosphoribosyltransferase [Candidatus Latescibacterota bacterium]
MTAANNLRGLIREIPDFPKTGILFRDITTLLRDPDGLRQAVEAMHAPFADETIDYVVGVEARGFIVGTPLALAWGAGFVPARKEGKLPGSASKRSYKLEYGESTIEIHDGAIPAGSRVLLADDLLATGGTMSAACGLVESFGASVIGLSFLVELTELKGRESLLDHRIESVISY